MAVGKALCGAALVVMLGAVSAAGWAQPLPPPPEPVPAPSVDAPAAQPQNYNEYSAYSATVRRSYVVGYAPKVSSLFENPRTYPCATGPLATPYLQYANRAGWFFGSPSGYQSSVPPGSDALAYNEGGMEITKRLSRGYPEGKRVVQPVLKPVDAVVEKGGILINANRAQEPLRVGPPRSGDDPGGLWNICPPGYASGSAASAPVPEK